MQLILKEIVGSLPTSIFDLVEGGHYVGVLHLRHTPSASPGLPSNFVSHIYYKIEASERRKGYGKEILRLGLKEAKKIGLKFIVTICDEKNIGSRKIIESNGGKLEDEYINNNGEKVLKYSFKI